MAYPLIKGKRVDFASFSAQATTADGRIVNFGRGLTKVDWSIKRSAKAHYAMGQEPLGQNEGQVAYAASLGIKWEEWETARDEIGEGYLGRRMHLIGSWRQRMDSGYREGKVEFLGFTITDESESASSDGTPEYALTLLPDLILVNGLRAVVDD